MLCQWNTVVYVRCLPDCCFTVICLSLILLCISLIYMYLIWFACNSLNDIIMISKVFVLISLYKKSQNEINRNKKRPNSIYGVFSIEKLIEERWSRKALQFSHLSCIWKNLIAENIWSILVISHLSFLNSWRNSL